MIKKNFEKLKTPPKIKEVRTFKGGGFIKHSNLSNQINLSQKVIIRLVESKMRLKGAVLLYQVHIKNNVIL